MSNSIIKRIKLFTAAVTQGGGGSVAWGVITGNINSQTDLKAALDSKLPVTATTADIDPSTDRNYVTDTQLESLTPAFGEVNIDFGKDGELSDNDLVIVTVTPADPSWITEASKIRCTVENDNTDHDAEDVYIENIIATPYNIIPGVSFDIITVAHNLTWGRYVVKYRELI